MYLSLFLCEKMQEIGLFEMCLNYLGPFFPLHPESPQVAQLETAAVTGGWWPQHPLFTDMASDGFHKIKDWSAQKE